MQLLYWNGTNSVPLANLGGTGHRAAWQTSAALPTGSMLPLPLPYTVGAASLRLFVDGVLLQPVQHYTEQGTAGKASTSVMLLFSLAAQSECTMEAIS